MPFFSTAALCAVVGLLQLQSVASSQTTSSSGSLGTATATTSSAVQTHTITVAKGDHKYVPDVVQAKVGDIIQFQFFPQNHSVARAEYLSPCIPYEDTGVDKVGFFSGFKPVDAILNDNASVSLAKQRALAMEAAYMLQPGEPFPAEASSSIASLATATTFSTATTAAAYTGEATHSATSSSSANGQSSHRDLSSGAIAGIVIGGVAVLALGAALFFLLGRTKTLKEVIDKNQVGTNRLSGPDMLQSNGAQFVPATTAGYRTSGNPLSNMGAYQKPPEESIRDNLSDHSTSPIVPYHNSFQFGNFYPQEGVHSTQNVPETQRFVVMFPMSTTMKRAVKLTVCSRFSDASGFDAAHQPLVNSQDMSGGPHELASPPIYDNRPYRPYRPTE
ncbi:hypothetical protein LTR66_011830 [Elasticomyces elasticus]|nr:hypothetical protein LTR66_011830 [Elasticomyces elasticus]